MLWTTKCLAVEDVKVWTEWLQQKRERFEQAKELHDAERISKLGDLLGDRSRIHSGLPLYDDRLRLYKEIREELLKVPGHSKYYADRINREFAAYKGTAQGEREDGSVNTLQREMTWGYRTMSQLPSPETVQALGEMFKEEWHEPLGAGGDYRPPSLAVASVNAMKLLPFIEPPTPSFKDYDAKNYLPAWQKWYAEVKSGERSFAFIGQPVSFRFKPDGSVDTQPRDVSNDPPLFPPAEKKDQKPEVPPASEAKQSSNLPWIIAGLTTVTLLMVFIFRKKVKVQ